MIGHRARRDPQQPRRERDAAPFELPDAGQRLAKHVRRQILGLVPVAYAPRDIGVHPVEILFVKFGEARGVALRGFNPRPVAGAPRHSPP